MDVQDPIALVVVEQMFPERLGVAQHTPVDRRGTRRETSLWAARSHRLPREELTMAGGEAVNGMSLRHGTKVAGHYAVS
nr:hypothetical protein Ade03nite_72050 [Actinoplanes derwentensis]